MIGAMLKALLGFGGGKNAMLDTMLAHHDAKLRKLHARVPPPGNAPARNSFTAKIPPSESSMLNMSARQRMTVGPTMMKLMREMGRSSRLYERPLPSPRREAPAEVFARVEELARAEGAAAVRAVRLTDDCLFAGLGVPHRNAIVYTVRMDKAALDTAPSFECFHEVARGYLRLAVIGNAVAAVLRNEGYDAFPGTALGGLSDYSRGAERAGLGSIGYHGTLITPHEGALLRINVIYTSIDNLPFHEPEPTSWIRDFCSMCRKCVRSCPAGAIHEQPIVLKNGRVECITSAKCLDYFASHFGCAICIDVCPFSQAGFSRVKEVFRGRDDAPRFSVHLDGTSAKG